MNKRWQRRLIVAAIAVASAVTALLLSDVRFFRLLRAKTYDAHFLVRGDETEPKIVLITIDSTTLDAFHAEPQLFWHRHYADAIHAAAEGGAKVMGIDNAFGVSVKKWEPDLDGILTDAVSQTSLTTMPVVIAYVPDFMGKQTVDPVPVTMAAAGLGLNGFPNLTADEIDDYVRRQILFTEPQDGAAYWPSLALRVTEKYLGQDAEVKDGKLTLAGRDIPVNADRTIAIDYAGGPGTFTRVPLAEVEGAFKHHNTAQLQSWFKDKIVLVGSDYTSDPDRRSTPFFGILGSGGGKWTTAGVEIHANTIHTLLDGVMRRPARPAVQIGAILAASVATAAAATVLSAGVSILPLLSIGLVVALISHFLFLHGVILHDSDVMVAATFCLIGSIIYRFATAETRGDLYHRAVSLFVSKKLAASLEATEAFGLSGKRETVTILFTDIRGFTAYSEKICDEEGPEFLVKKLNEYLGVMAAIIVGFGGHVNKYIGDGILAVFSEEDEGAKPGDHAMRAVQCALQMVQSPSEFKTGAGLHTGVVVVGNIGSADKMEYTVLGDTVNLASRLESLNKEHKTKLLLSDTTKFALGGSIATTHLGSVPVRGKTEPIHLFTLSELVVPENKDVPQEVRHA